MDHEIPKDFLRQIVAEDIAAGRYTAPITRFPPEPNGYLHIGHAKSICLNFGIAEEFAGACHMRFDDTNPAKEDQEYVDSILADVRWLGFNWTGPVRYASDYFDQIYTYAEQLIQVGKAYVCDLNAEQMREYRGTLTQPGRDSPGRKRPIDENLDLFRRMRSGEFAEGALTLRARIDMSSPNINLRDPVLYRIRHAEHHQTGARWCIYPSYDFTHPLSDAIEGITHSLCTLEFEDHRPFYDWLIQSLKTPAQPRQYEFARLNLSYTLTSKRKLKQLVDQGFVEGWDDPRMPTLAGIRRRGIPAAALRRFCQVIGVTRADSMVDVALLDFCVREYLEAHAPRAMAVLRPLKVILTNWDEGDMELVAPVHQQRPELGERKLPFGKTIYIDREDFAEQPPKGWKRLVPGGEVRLRQAYVIRCDDVVHDAEGKVIELHCSVDKATLGANPEGRKVKGVIHWVSAEHAMPATVRIYDRLFAVEDPEADGGDFTEHLNPDSLQVLQALIEPGLVSLSAEDAVQFEREGYFVADRLLWAGGERVFNRIIGLKDSWGKGQGA
ncbi:MAG: glutamine--tRNA ligase/YqeY domain fusion protein [Pseudomonadales bacterium]|nr:glutamine--tRNA ligase/YqeY domain fusion protein [Pseudomonadales bacterium]